jgi:hypothetical protein
MIDTFRTNPPQAGRGWGLNKFLFTRTIHLLRDGHKEDEILAAFLANEKVTSVTKPGEIERQVSQAVLIYDPNKPYEPKPKIAYDAGFAFPILKTAAGALERLQEASPRKGATPEEIIDAMFPAEEWICCGTDKELPNQAKKYIAHCYPKSFWLQDERLSKMAYLVPNPMKGKEGKNQQGRPSTRCIDNVKERRFVVFEGDVISKTEQAAMLLHLSKYAKLVVVTDSGGKSLHGYFATEGAEDEDVEKFLDLSIRLGADPAHRNPSQFARMPGGLRDKTVRQQILYFNP